MSSTVKQRVESWMKMPGFTALNGAGSPRSPMDDTAGTIEVRLLPSAQSAQSAHDEREYSLNKASPHTAEPRTLPDVSAATRREREIWGTSPLDRSPYRSPATAYPNLENPAETSQKRKRSLSVEETTHSRHPSHHQQHQRGESDLPRILSATETAAAAIAAASAASAASRERDAERPRASVEPRDPYDLPRSRDYMSRQYADDHREQQQREQHHADMWYSRASRDERHSASAYDNAAYHQRSRSAQSPADEHSGNDSHQREKSIQQASASPQSEYAGRTPDEEDRSGAYGAPFSPDQQRKGGSSLQQSDPKRRKRNFSNRTKTGCLTCRKRKKKCDETKPECSNCVRGGFICAGYPPQKGQWGKPDVGKPTVQIESKDPTYVPPGAYGMPGALNGSQGGAFQQQRRESLPHYRGQALRIEPPQGRLLQTDDDRPTASTLPSALTSADSHNKLSALSAFSAPANAFPTPVSAATTIPFMDRTPKEYQRVPPLHDLSRTTEPETPLLATPLPQISIHRSGSPPYQQPSPQQHQLPTPLQAVPPQPQHQHQQSQSQSQPQSQPQSLQQHHHHRQHSQNEQPHQLDQALQVHQQHQHEHAPQHQPQHSHQPHHQAHQHQSPHQFHPPHPHPPQHQHQHQHRPLSEHQPRQQVNHQHPRHPQQQHQDPSPVEKQTQFPHRRPYSPPLQVPHQPQHQPDEVDEAGETIEAHEARLRARKNIPFFSTIPGPRREREEMHAERPFYQFDQELVDERERCAAACWKFNNSTNPNIGVSQSERTRLFKEILQPRGDSQTPPNARVGSVGEQAVVDAPFHADYGYNITIGHAVHIGRNCHFSDAMPISIGNRVTIGPNVSFYTISPSTDHTERDGVHSALHGRGITIGDGVFIGGNVTILSGANIGHGAVIGAGSVVTSSVPRFTVSYGNPAVVKRGIAQV